MLYGLLFLSGGLLGQLGTGNNDYGPVVARNKTGTTDFVWISSGSVLLKRNETPCCNTTSPSTLGTGDNPECDVDDDTSITGGYNSVVVWHKSNSGTDEIWVSVNAGTAVRVGQKADSTYETGFFPRVAIARTGGKFVVTWGTGSHTGAVRGQLYQIGSGSTVSRWSYPFAVSVVNAMGPTGDCRNYAVSCADNGDFVANYVRAAAGYGGPPSGVIVRGFYMPSVFGAPAEKFPEKPVAPYPYYGGSDVACYYDGSFVVAWSSGTPAARRYSAAGNTITNTDVSITSGCSYAHPCGTTDGYIDSAAQQDQYNVSVAAQRCSPGNYVVGYHKKRGSDSWETYRLRICADYNRTHCQEDVAPMAASDSYPEPDIYKWARVAMDDCGRMVGTFPGYEFGSSGTLIYTYLESLCNTCETTCISELQPCLEIPVPDCGATLLAGASGKKGTKRKETPPSSGLALAPVPIDGPVAKAAVAAKRPSPPLRPVARLEAKPIMAAKRHQPATN